MAWWRDAGLSHDYADATSLWIEAEPAPAPSAAAPNRGAAPGPAPVDATPPPAPIIDRADWPQDLAAFAPWWLEDALPAPAGARRVPPRGPSGADLMIIVPMPEAEDTTDLLSGPRGRCLSAMLGAMGIPADAVYLASALPACDPLPDWADLAAQRLGELLAHHIALVAPRRVCVFGQSILPLLNHGPTQTTADLHIINQKGPANTAGLPPIFGSPDLDLLVKRPAQRRRFWHDWLEWSA